MNFISVYVAADIVMLEINASDCYELLQINYVVGKKLQ